MAATKTERLMKLLIMLLVQRHYVSKDRIRQILYDDAPSVEAFEKRFERDKEELRSLGVPIEVGTLDPLFEDEVGYRISKDAFALPEIELTGDEAALLGLATRVWQHAKLADATADAVRKLAAAGVDVDVAALDIAEPRLTADEPGFEIFWQAVQERIPVRFGYRRTGAAEAAERHLQPWGIVRYSGRWYVVGYDTDRAAERVFRLSRVQGSVVLDGEPGAYEVPPGTDVRAVARRLAPTPSPERVELLVRPGAGLPLRKHADEVVERVPGPDGTDGWDRVVLSRSSQELADEVLSFGADVYVVEPVSLRDTVVSRLTRLLEHAGGAA